MLTKPRHDIGVSRFLASHMGKACNSNISCPDVVRQILQSTFFLKIQRKSTFEVSEKSLIQRSLHAAISDGTRRTWDLQRQCHSVWLGSRWRPCSHD
jgi:hypothetical protein